MEFDTTALTPVENERLINSLVVPRPIAWVTTLDAEGRGNLAPFSYFNVVSGGTPPIVMISFSTKGYKHTLANLVATGEFVVNVVSHELSAAMVASSGDYPSGVDEAALVGLDVAPGAAVRPGRLAAAPAALECRTVSTSPVDAFTVALGRVVHIHVADAVLRDGRVDPALLQPVARLGGSLYAALGDAYRIERPSLQGEGERSPR